MSDTWFCRSLFGMKCTSTENDGRDHDQCGVAAVLTPGTTLKSLTTRTAGNPDTNLTPGDTGQ